MKLDIFVEYDHSSADSVEAYFNKYVVSWIVELRENEKNILMSYAAMEEKNVFSKKLVCETEIRVWWEWYNDDSVNDEKQFCSIIIEEWCVRGKAL